MELYAEEERDDLPLVNRLRADVKRWRESGYRGASPVTKELLAWWARPDALRPLFYCQREAAETVIYLLELALPGRLLATGFRTFEVGAEDLDRLLRGERPKFDELRPDADFFPRLVDPPVDSSLIPLRRLGCKMATGSGKTALMSMIISWAFCNRGRNPGSTWFPSAVLICAPNLTVRKRLQVLYPADPKNYYDEFELVPGKYRELLAAGKVMITNWHTLALKSEHSEGGVSYKVVDKGKETDDAFTMDRLGDLAQRLPILVLNDEGHHCWRPAPGDAGSEKTKGLSAEEKKALEEDAEEARIWLAGLDRINNSGLVGKSTPGVLAAVDMSAVRPGEQRLPGGEPIPLARLRLRPGRCDRVRHREDPPAAGARRPVEDGRGRPPGPEVLQIVAEHRRQPFDRRQGDEQAAEVRGGVPGGRGRAPHDYWPVEEAV